VTTEHELQVLSDLDLIAAMNRGDAGAFEVLYYRYRGWVAGLALRFTEDPDASFDVLQETFLYFLRKFPGFCLTANLKTFFYPAVRNLSIAARKKAARYQATSAELEHLERVVAPDPPPDPGEELQLVLSSLPEEQREVLMLRFVDGLTLGEISDAMEIPLGTVKSRLHNALHNLRENPLTQRYFAQ
jgi:RNA polymerase sigma-70 factor, ECF subfamily